MQKVKISPESQVNDSYRFTLKNGRVGQQYFDELAFDKLSVSGKIEKYEVRIKDFHKNYADLSEIGLYIYKEKKVISGEPTVPGKPEENYDFHLEINYETDKKEKEN